MEEKEAIRSPQTLGCKSRVTTHSVLSQRHYKKVCFIGAVAFLVSFLAIGIYHLSIKDGICHNEIQISQWAREFNIASAGALVVAIVLQVNRINLSTFREDNDIGTLSTYYASIVVNTISASSHLGAILFQWGGICRDAFGVYSPAVIWPEWAVSVPLLFFITVSVDDRPSLCREDVLTIISMHLSIVSASFMLVVSDTRIAFLLVLLSCIFCIPCVLLVGRTSRDLDTLLKKSMESESKRGFYQRKILLASRKATLSACLGYLIPIFPLIYFLRVRHLIDDNLFFVAIMFASAFTKVTFASLCMDAHLEVSHPAVALIDAENFANTSRRAFLRFVFHEVRVPLNSISMGVQVLDSSDKIVEEDRETIAMVKEAVTFMGETLNDVMALQKVEEGSLELIYKSFSVVDLFQNVEDSFIDTSVEYGVILSTDIDPKIPARIIGDKFRIRHVLANLVSNALKYSYSGGHVQLRAYLDPDADSSEYGSLPVHGSSKFVTVLFSVVDEGKGISEEDQEEDIFQPYRLLKHGEFKHGRGTGLGLAICKEIVRMHSGQIWYTSKLGEGSAFYVSLPLEISLDNKQRTTGTWYRQQRNRGSSRKSLTTKMMSHWNVMMATSSQADMIHSVTPSPGLQSRNFSSSSPYGDMRRPTSSSSEGTILIDSSLEDSDLFEVRKISDRAVEELSGESQSKYGPFKPTNKTDKRAKFARNPSAKSVELTESDVVNLHPYEEDGEEELFTISERNDDVSLTKEVSHEERIGDESEHPLNDDMKGHTNEDEKLSICVPTGGEVSAPSSTPLKTTGPSTISRRQPSLSPEHSSASLKVGKSTANVEKPSGANENSKDSAILASSSVSKYSDKNNHSPSYGERVSNLNSASKSPFARFPKTFLGDSTVKDSSYQSNRNVKKTSISSEAQIPKPSRPNVHIVLEDDTSPMIVPSIPSSQTCTNSSASQLDQQKSAYISPNGGKSTVLNTMNHQGVASLSTPPSSPFNHRYNYYNVLIVDDVTSNRKLLALLLNKRGIHSISFAEDGALGLEMVREKGVDAFDIIFMDNTMPRMTGIEATTVIRRCGYDNLIIGVTGNSMEDELRDFIVAGADLVITKPMKPHVLDILLQFVSTFGCRSHPNQRLVIRNTSLEWVNTDSSGRALSKGCGSSFL